MTDSPQKNNGCLWLFVFGLLCFLGTAIISVFFGIKVVIAFLITAVFSVLLTTKMVGTPRVSSIFKNIILVFLIIMGVRFVLLSLLDFVKTSVKEDTTFNVEEGVAKSTIVEGVDTVSVYSSHRVWKDNFGNSYQGKLTVREKDFLRLDRHIDRYKPSGSANFWGRLYDHIERTDTPSLDLVMHAFEDIHQQRKLNQMEFAEMVISCVQDIPYSFVFQDACLSANNYEESIRQLLEQCPECCIGNIPYGIQNPVSFLQNLKGDCDTRTVLIYSVLKYFNYDVAILNSDFYRHSIIGINLPASGIYKTYYGKKYVVWETTAKYYTAGQLPVNFNDINYWDVVLTSK
ncbi:MAG TPA: hypothetical protein PKW08_05795 [Flavobacteriaceae bacterium]|nr:hypothetical protein [Flavobacteriaceae bacterium]MCB9214106.1 hypothetical protein [Alteromonas sp.]HPF11553.1 hypothetical protein [Flavobacteriaceae bacterium]HQU21086.1 hypothetical protein [Flavobacteriaceae bacterium]HQU65238.1 hypothetical protein [Flavobacteriaceae bacterium]